MLLSVLLLSQADTPTQCFDRCLRLLAAAAGQKKVAPHRPILGRYWAFGRPTRLTRGPGAGAVFFEVDLSTSRPNRRQLVTAVGLVPLRPGELPASDPASRWLTQTDTPFKLLMDNVDRAQNLHAYLYGLRLTTVNRWSDRQLTAALIAIARNPAQPRFHR